MKAILSEKHVEIVLSVFLVFSLLAAMAQPSKPVAPTEGREVANDQLN
jgi:hypothetical protein